MNINGTFWARTEGQMQESITEVLQETWKLIPQHKIQELFGVCETNRLKQAAVRY